MHTGLFITTVIWLMFLIHVIVCKLRSSPSSWSPGPYPAWHKGVNLYVTICMRCSNKKHFSQNYVVSHEYIVFDETNLFLVFLVCQLSSELHKQRQRQFLEFSEDMCSKLIIFFGHVPKYLVRLVSLSLILRVAYAVIAFLTMNVVVRQVKLTISVNLVVFLTKTMLLGKARKIV